MKSEPIEIPRVAGPVTVERTGALARVKVRVDGEEAPYKRPSFLLPSTMGLPVQAKVKFRGDPLPSLEFGDATYRFGPHNPRLLWVLAALPLLWAGLFWEGMATEAIGYLANYAVMVSTRWPAPRKVAATLAVTTATIPVASLLGLSLQDWYREVSGEEPISPRVADFGDCVDTSGGSAVEVELGRVTDCATSHDGEVVFITTHSSSSATYAQGLGPVAWCREAGDPRLSSPIIDVPYRIRIATDGENAEQPQAGDSWACVVEREDGKQLTSAFSCADLSVQNDPRCPDPFRLNDNE